MSGTRFSSARKRRSQSILSRSRAARFASSGPVRQTRYDAGGFLDLAVPSLRGLCLWVADLASLHFAASAPRASTCDAALRKCLANPSEGTGTSERRAFLFHASRWEAEPARICLLAAGHAHRATFNTRPTSTTTGCRPSPSWRRLSRLPQRRLPRCRVQTSG